MSKDKGIKKYYGVSEITRALGFEPKKEPHVGGFLRLIDAPKEPSPFESAPYCFDEEQITKLKSLLSEARGLGKDE